MSGCGTGIFSEFAALDFEIEAEVPLSVATTFKP
jgi:hypothetical protein